MGSDVPKEELEGVKTPTGNHKFFSNRGAVIMSCLCVRWLYLVGAMYCHSCYST